MGLFMSTFSTHHLEKIANFSEIDFFEAYKEVTKAIPIAGNDNEPIIDVIGSEHLSLPCLQMDHTLSKLAKELNYRAADYQIKSGTAHIAISGIPKCLRHATVLSTIVEFIRRFL